MARSYDEFEQLLDRFREHLIKGEFDQCRKILANPLINSFIDEDGREQDYPFLVEVYSSPDLNAAMTNFIHYLIACNDLELILATGSDESVLSRAIQFNAEELFDLLKERREIVYGSSPDYGLNGAVNRCPNPHMIYECFRLNLLDLRYADFRFLQTRDPYFVEIARFLLNSETLVADQQALSNATRIYTATTFTREETLRDYLRAALIYTNLPVARYLLSHGIRPRRLPENPSMRRLIEIFNDPNYEFSRNDYVLMQEARQGEIRTIVTLAQDSQTLLNALPRELQDAIITHLDPAV